MERLQLKLEQLQQKIRDLRRVIVAFSGGVDSSLLLKVAADTLPPGDVLAVTAFSSLMPTADFSMAKKVAMLLGVEHRVIETDEFQHEALTSNHTDRCYHCKLYKYTLLTELATREGYQAVLDGSNLSDCQDYRPGARAIEELELVHTPLKDCNLDKQEIRELSRQLGLPTWDQPSRACLSSRIPYGERITPEKIAMVSRAEDALAALGLANFRVRCHGNLARIEIDPAEMGSVLHPEFLQRVSQTVKACGFTYAALDLDGYRLGSMNEAPLYLL